MSLGKVILRGRGQGRGRGGRQRRQRGRSKRSIRLLEPALLFLLHSGPDHGYSLLDRLNEFDLDNLNPSVVYRALREMEAQGWVQSKWEGEETQGPPRRIYELTTHGVEMLTLWAKDLEESRGRIDRLLQTYKRDLDDG